MTLFVILASLMTAAALLWLLVPLLRKRTAADVDRQRANLGVLRDQLAELDAEHARGALADNAYLPMKADLERRVLEESRATATAAPGEPAYAARARLAAAMLAVGVPVMAALAYWQFGDPQAFNPLLASPADKSAHALQPEQIAKMVRALEDRLQREPDNANGWITLARTYSSQKRFADAASAYAKLVELVPDDADLLADYADTLAMAEGRRIGPASLALINKALRLNPTQWKALAMAGTEAFERKDYATAVDYWERLQASLPPDAPMARGIAASIAEARQLGGKAPAPLAKAPAAPAKSAGASAGASTGARITGTVSLSPALVARASPDDIVFVFARAAEGPRMPLALIRTRVRELPLKFTLDDSLAMSPEFKLSAYPQVVVGARVSKSGQASAASGDFEGLTPTIKLGASNVVVTVDRIVP